MFGWMRPGPGSTLVGWKNKNKTKSLFENRKKQSAHPVHDFTWNSIGNSIWHFFCCCLQRISCMRAMCGWPLAGVLYSKQYTHIYFRYIGADKRTLFMQTKTCWSFLILLRRCIRPNCGLTLTILCCYFFRFSSLLNACVCVCVCYVLCLQRWGTLVRLDRLQLRIKITFGRRTAHTHKTLHQKRVYCNILEIIKSRFKMSFDWWKILFRPNFCINNLWMIFRGVRMRSRAMIILIEIPRFEEKNLSQFLRYIFDPSSRICIQLPHCRRHTQKQHTAHTHSFGR